MHRSAVVAEQQINTGKKCGELWHLERLLQADDGSSIRVDGLSSRCLPGWAGHQYYACGIFGL